MAKSINSTSANTLPTFEGVVVYTIENDGCLNGMYANTQTPTPHEVFNEIAKLIPPRSTKDRIAGDYRVSWNSDTDLVIGKLTITHTTRFYQVDWYDSNGKHVFTGKGFITGPH